MVRIDPLETVALEMALWPADAETVHMMDGITLIPPFTEPFQDRDVATACMTVARLYELVEEARLK